MKKISLLKFYIIIKKNILTCNEVKRNLESLETKSKDILKYKAKLLSLEDSVLDLFLNHIKLNLNEDDLIKKCKLSLKSSMIPEENIDDLFKKLDSSIREENYNTIKNHQKIVINFHDYYKKYRIYYDQARNTNLRIKKFKTLLPDNLNEQSFIQHLIDINDISDDDIDDIIEFTKYKLQIQNNIRSWLHEGELTKEQLEAFEKNVKTIWKNEFRSRNRGQLSDEQIKEKALLIVDNLRKKKLTISSLELDIQHSNGEFYYLSDNLQIGWRKDWKEKYHG
jgi:hypothetical protein